MADQLLRAENMTVGYGGVPLIRDIALSVSGGEILSLVGPNGSGKSTILKSLIRELALLGGTVYLDGRDSSRLSAAETARTLAVMMTGRIAPERMTCWDVAAAAAALRSTAPFSGTASPSPQACCTRTTWISRSRAHSRARSSPNSPISPSGMRRRAVRGRSCTPAAAFTRRSVPSAR